MPDFYFVLQIIGTVAFAVSGALEAIEKKMDIFGVAVLGMTTAVGGGIIRDIITGSLPPVVFTQPVYVFVSLGVGLIVFLPPVRRFLKKTDAVLLVMDSIGLGIFTVVGAKAGMMTGNAFLAVFVAVVTGVGGGVMRDLFAGIKPQIFVKHFYACASIIGAVLCVALFGLGENAAMVSGAALIALLRILAARFRWSLPKA